MASSTGNMENPESKEQVEKDLVAAAQTALDGVKELIAVEQAKVPAAPAPVAPAKPTAPAPAPAKPVTPPTSPKPAAPAPKAPEAEPSVQEDFLSQEERIRRRGSRRM